VWRSSCAKDDVATCEYPEEWIGSAIIQATECAESKCGSPRLRRANCEWYHPVTAFSEALNATLNDASAPMLIHIDGRSRLGLQQQIYEAIRRSILEGVLPPGAKLPSSRALAIDLRVSRTTTLLAYEQLMAEGYLSAAHGSGTFVASDLPDDRLRRSTPRRAGKLRHPPLSKRGLAVAATPLSALRLPGQSRAFRIGVPALDLFPVRLWSQIASRQMRNATIAQLDYGDGAGWRPLREAIATHVSVSRGTRCTADQIMIVPGTQRGLTLVCQMLLDPGDTAWMEEPGYCETHGALTAAGANVVAVRTDENGLDVAAGERLGPAARLACVTPSHQFPLAVQMSLPRRLALLAWASRARAWIVEDDYDSEYRYGTRPIPCLHGLDRDGRVIYVGSFSKTLFPSLRLGFLIVPEDLDARMRLARRTMDRHPPTFDQSILATFISSGHYERHLRRMRTIYHERLDALAAGLDRYCKGALTLRPVRTGLHAVADLQHADADRVFAEAAARGIEVMPLSAYYFSRQKPANALVLGFASNRPDALAAGAALLAEAIEGARRPEKHPGSRFRKRE
jgi:GntR family transcriptional regulator/MocR family aminotransferase